MSIPSLFYDASSVSREDMDALRAEVAALRDDIMSLAHSVTVLANCCLDMPPPHWLKGQVIDAAKTAEAISDKHGREL